MPSLSAVEITDNTVARSRSNLISNQVHTYMENNTTYIDIRQLAWSGAFLISDYLIRLSEILSMHCLVRISDILKSQNVTFCQLCGVSYILSILSECKKWSWSWLG